MNNATTGTVRLAYIDNIRWLMIVFVLSMHSADTYSPFGNWYYTEHPKSGVATIAFFSFYQSFLQAFFMALLFFIAGYFTPGSLDKKGAMRFIYDRFVRLGIPTLIFMLVVGPLTEYYISKTWRTHDSFLQAWWGHIADGEVLGMSGPMWFCAALLIFSIAYTLIRQATNSFMPGKPRVASPSSVGAVLVIAAIAVTTFVAEVLNPDGVSVFNMHLNDFPSYIIMFGLGVYAFRTTLLSQITHQFGKRWGLIGLGVGFVLWPVLIVTGGALQGDTSAYGGGWHWQAFGMCVWASTICVGVSLGLLDLYRERFNRQDALARFMSANAFAVYLFHPPILIGLALAFRGIDASAVVKFLILTVASVMVNFLAADLLFRRIPLLKRVL